MENIVIIIILALIASLAVFYIVREKKKGKKCIGCPYNCSLEKCSCCKKQMDGEE